MDRQLSEHKVCPVCKNRKSAGEFGIRKKSGFLDSYCISCRIEYHRRAYADDRENILKKQKQYYIDNPDKKDKMYRKNADNYYKQRDAVLDHYGKKCNCCGETEKLFLSIDHVNNDGCVDRKGNGHGGESRNIIAKIMRENFPKEYQVLCMNCNHGKMRNNGTCPHVRLLAKSDN